MKVKNITHRFVAVCTFAIGLGAVLLWSNSFHRDNSHNISSEVISILKPARVVSYMSADDAARIPTLTNKLMIVSQPPQSSVSTSVSLHTEDESLIESNCGTLLISVDANRKVSLNDEELGTFEKLPEVISKIRGFFRDRTRMGVYRRGMKSRFDIPEEDRIYRTVLIKPAPELTYAEVIRIIELVKDTGAKPIALSISY